jgi:hypothetical protein
MRYSFLCLFAVVVSTTLLAQQSATNPYGVCAHLPRGGEFKTHQEELKLIREAGLGWVRADFDWSGVQREANGPWTFDHLDTVIGNAEAKGIQMLPILDYNVSFANPAFKHLDLWGKYVSNTVTRYQHRLPVWEIWNEQNLEGFWKNANADDYFILLKKTYETIKAVNPKLTVAVGGYAGVPMPFIEKLYQCGGAPYFDIMNVHPYSHPAVPETRLEAQLTELKALMTKYGDEKKPIWITEIGWPTQKNRVEAPGILKAGLQALNPDRKEPWHIAVIDDPSYSETSAPADDLLKDECPSHAQIQRLTLDALFAAIDSSSVDAIVLPFDEHFPEDGFDKLLAFVRKGGVLIEYGGMPIWDPMKRQADGTWKKSKAYGESFRDQLRIGVEAWWYKKGVIPEKMQVSYVGPAQALTSAKKRVEAERFLKPHNFKEGDRFIPLLAGTHNSYTGTAAAVYAFNSDLKGAVIVSALFERGQRGNSEAKQAKMIPRANLIAFQCGVERIFWYEFQAPEVDPLDQESHFGFVHQNLSPKPAYAAYKTLIAMRPPGSVMLDRPWKSADNALYYPQWKCPNGRAAGEAGAIWAYKKAGSYRLTFSAKGIWFTSHTGEQTAISLTDNTCVLPLTDAPLYFTGGTLEKIEKL